MPTRIDNLTPYAAELLDFGGVAPAAGKGLVWDGEGKLVAADVVVQSDLSAYATISSVTSALATKADASALSAHTAATDNPHGVTAEQVGAYTTTQVDNLISALTYSDVGAAAAEHGHVIGDVTGLQTALDGKGNLSGGNTWSGTQYFNNISEFAININSGYFLFNEFGVEIYKFGLNIEDGGINLVNGNLTLGSGSISAPTINEGDQPLRERYTRHFLNLESTEELTTLPAAIGDQATVQTGDANDPIHRYELMGDDLDGGTYDTPAENLANWRRIVALDADGEIKGPILHRLVLATDDTDVARIGEIVCVVDDLDNPTTASYRMGDGTTKTANLPEIATVTP